MQVLGEWKQRLERLFEDLQNYGLPDTLLDEIETLVNEAVHLKEELILTHNKLESQTQDLFFLRTELSILRPHTTPQSLRITPLDPLSITPIPHVSPPTPIQSVPPNTPIVSIPTQPVPPPTPTAPILVLTPKPSTRKNTPTAPLKPKYRLLFWTKIDDLPTNSIFGPAKRQAEIRFSLEDLAKFAPLPANSMTPTHRKSSQGGSVLPQRRALVIETGLKALGLTAEQIISKLVNCEMDLCGNYEKLTVLYGALPKEEDFAAVQPLMGMRNVALSQAESFVLGLSSISCLKSLLDCILFQASFDLTYSELTLCLNNWLRICRILLTNDDLRSIYLIILSLGNALNDGHPRLSGAQGFKVEILEDLAMIRSMVEPGVSLLDIVIAKFFGLRRERVKFYSKEEYALLREVAAANAFTLFNSCSTFIQQYHSTAKADFSPQFRSHMSTFLSSKTTEIAKLTHLIDECRESIKDVHEYFGEKEETDSEGSYLLFRHLSRFYETCEGLYQRLAIGKTGPASSKRYTLTPTERYSLRRQSRLPS